MFTLISRKLQEWQKDRLKIGYGHRQISWLRIIIWRVGVFYEFPQPTRAERDLQYLQALDPQRVLQRLREQWADGDGTRFPRALHADGVERRRRLFVAHIYVGHV